MDCPECGTPIPEAEDRCPACQAPPIGDPRRAPRGSEPAKDHGLPPTRPFNRYFWGFLALLALAAVFLTVVL